MIKAAIGTLLMLALLTALSQPHGHVGFERDTTPVDVRKYWPVPPPGLTHTVVYRRYDGSLYAKRMTKNPNDPMFTWLPASQLGGIHFSREDYIPTDYGPIGGDPAFDPIAYFNNSWSMVLRSDWSVSEIADSWPLQQTCVSWCASRGQYYAYSQDPSRQGDIVHGRPGGHVLGEAYYYKMNVDVWHTPNLQNERPTYLDGVQVYSIIRMEAKYSVYTPEFGRTGVRLGLSAVGHWGAGNGRSYRRVIKMVLQHGTRSPSSPEYRCERYPPGFSHRDGYTSFWQYLWYADGIGMIKESLLFDERPDEHGMARCLGAAQAGKGLTPIVYDDYVDDPR